MITNIDRDTCRLLASEIEAAVQAVATKHGVQIKAKGGSFTDTSYTMKLEVAVLGDGGVAVTQERTSFLRLAGLYGMKPEWIDQSFVHGRDKFIIVGLNTRKSKRPVLCKSTANGKTYIFEATTVARLMNAQGVTVAVVDKTSAAATNAA